MTLSKQRKSPEKNLNYAQSQTEEKQTITGYCNKESENILTKLWQAIQSIFGKIFGFMAAIAKCIGKKVKSAIENRNEIEEDCSSQREPTPWSKGPVNDQYVKKSAIANIRQQPVIKQLLMIYYTE